MARTRALLTKNDRAVLSGAKGDDDRRRNVRWEVQNRVRDELPEDVAVLSEHHPDLLEELRETVCERDGRPIICPKCGREFDRPSDAIQHLTGETTHAVPQEELSRIVPDWWTEEQDGIENWIEDAG